MSAREIVEAWGRRGQPLLVPGAATRIWSEGEGEPVVCLHGVPASAFLYRKTLPALASRGLRGVAFDLPGLGFAERPRAFDYSWSGLGAWVEGALNAAGLDRVHWIVHDIGGPIGFEVIRRCPGRTLSLTALDTMVRVANFRRPWVMEPFAHSGAGWLWLQSMRTPIFVALMRWIGVHDTPGRDELRAYTRLLLGDDGGWAFLRIMRSFETTAAFEAGIVEALRQRDFPAQVIWGAHDSALQMQRFAPLLCEVLGLPAWHRVQGKHFLQEDAFIEIADRVATLVAEARPSNAQP